MDMDIEEIDRHIGMPDIDVEWAQFRHEYIDAPSAKTGFHLGRVAAVILATVGVSVTMLASAYLIRVMPARQVGRQPAVVVPDSTRSVQVAPDTTLFVFDNVEMEVIASTLGTYYGLEPQFRDRNARHVRLYATIKKSSSIDEVVAFLNNFKKIKLSVHDGKLIVESKRQAAE